MEGVEVGKEKGGNGCGGGHVGRGGEVMGEVMGKGGEGGLACVWMLECAGARKRRMEDSKGLRMSVEE